MKIQDQQDQYMWFNPETTPPPTSEERFLWLDRKNTVSPWYGFIGNDKAVSKIHRIEFDALGKCNHVCNDLSVALLGPPGCGKTDFARRHAKSVGLPFVEISPKTVRNSHDVFLAIKDVCDNAIPPLPLTDFSSNSYIAPPSIVFLDEVHALKDNVVQGLLKATEHKDRILVTEKGTTLNCRNVQWMIATTDRGKLFDAFDTRFSKITLNPYTKDQIAALVKVNYTDWDNDVCGLVAHYCSRIPREALAFAREMELEANMSGNLKEAAKKVAEDNEIDPYGMSLKRLAILKALGQGPVSAKRMVAVAGVKEEELDKFIMPWLLTVSDDQGALVTVTSKGYTITGAGLLELDKRGIPHNGDNALAA